MLIVVHFLLCRLLLLFPLFVLGVPGESHAWKLAFPYCPPENGERIANAPLGTPPTHGGMVLLYVVRPVDGAPGAVEGEFHRLALVSLRRSVMGACFHCANKCLSQFIYDREGIQLANGAEHRHNGHSEADEDAGPPHVEWSCVDGWMLWMGWCE